MAVFYALMYAYWPLQTAFKAIHFSRPLFVANGIAIVVMFTLGIWTILQWGVYGTLIGQILNALVVAVILWSAWLGIIWRNRETRDELSVQQPPG
jgi:Na+-driven multidrug efflux pump